MKDHEGIIVLGSPRSGTTLLRRLLDAHPDICCPGETLLFRGCARFLEHDIISGGFDYGVLGALEGLGYGRNDVKARLREFAVGFYREMAQKAGKKHWAAKTAVDSFYLDEIETLFADHAKFICVVRHGLDVVCSMEELSRDLQTYISELHDYVRLYPNPHEAFAHAWSDVMTSILNFAEKYPYNCQTIRYEDLVANPDEEMEKITAFLELPPLPDKASSILKKKSVDGIGDWKSFKKTKVEKSSVNRWQDQLSPAEVQMLAQIVNPVLEKFGYNRIERENDEDARRRRELAQMMMQSKL